MPEQQQLQKQPSVPAFEVGWMFVHEYYTFLNKEPAKLHCFYTKKSTLTHGVEGETVQSYLGQHEIHDKILSLDLKDCKVLVSNVDSHPSANGGIVIQVLGEMSNNSGPSRKFAQTFFLAEQPKGYYVLNDIFRYLKEDDDEEIVQEEQAYTQPNSVPATPTTVVTGAPGTTGTTETTATSASDDGAEPATTTNGWPAFHDYNGTRLNGYASANDKTDSQTLAPVGNQVTHSTPMQTEQSQPIQGSQSSENDHVPAVDYPNQLPEQAQPQFQQLADVNEEKSHQVAALAPSVVLTPRVSTAAPSAPKTWANLVANNKWSQLQQPSITSGYPAQPSSPKPPAPVSSPQQSSPHPIPQHAQQQRKRDESVTVFLKGLSSETTVQSLTSSFSTYAPVKSFDFATNRAHGFLELHSSDDYNRVLAIGKIKIDGTVVYIEERRRPSAIKDQRSNRQQIEGKRNHQQQSSSSSPSPSSGAPRGKSRAGGSKRDAK